MMQSLETTVRVSGKGNSKQEALNRALYKIQKQVMKLYPDSMILRIEPVDVTVVSANKMTYSEKFFFFFFKRIRENFNVTLDIEIQLSLMAINEVSFIEKNQNNTNIIQNLAKKVGGRA